MSLKFSWPIVSFKTTVSLLIFCLADLSIDANGCWSSLLLLHYVKFLFYVCYYLCVIFRYFYIICFIILWHLLVLTLLFWQNDKTQGCCQETEKQIQLLAILWVKRDKNWTLSLLWTVCKNLVRKEVHQTELAILPVFPS